MLLQQDMRMRGDRNFNKEIIGSVKYMKIEMFKPGAFTVLSLLHLCNIDIGKMGYRRKLNGFIVRNELGWEVSGSDIHLDVV